jgi:hypothetical protein
MKHLDRHGLMVRFIVCFPHDREAATADRLDQQKPPIPECIPGKQLSPLAELSAQIEDLAVEVLRGDPSLLQPASACTSVMEPLAQRHDRCVAVRGDGLRRGGCLRRELAHRPGAGIR